MLPMADNADMPRTNTEKLAHYEQRLDMWENAEADILAEGQSYVLDDEGLKRQLTNVSMAEVRRQIILYNNRIIRLRRAMATRGGNMVFGRGR